MSVFSNALSIAMELAAMVKLAVSRIANAGKLNIMLH
jgi:hypothetical protein